MAETLDRFLDRQLRVVETDGKNTATIRLVELDSQQTFERWDRPLTKEAGGPGPEKLASDIDDLITGYRDDFPKNVTVQMGVIAEDADGATRGKWVKSLRGKSESGSRSMIGGDVSLAEGSRLHVETTKRLLEMATAQNSLFAQQVKQVMEQSQTFMVLMMNEQMQRVNAQTEHAETTAGGDEQMQRMLEKIYENMAPLVALGVEALKKSNAPPAGVAFNHQTNGVKNGKSTPSGSA